MEYVKFGSTGVKVSRLCLGCMTFGEPDRGNHPWTLDEEKSRPVIRQAIEQGINDFDTANVYSDGSSEEITGRLLKEFASRDDIVLATKVYNRMRPGPNGMGLSRKAIMQEIDASLTRLRTDYVDLYQIHRFDYDTPIEETLEALHDVVKAGKARYIGASRCRPGCSPRLVRLTAARLDGVRQHAESCEPPLPRGGAGDVASVRRGGRRGDAVEPTGAWAADASLGRDD